MEKLRKFDEMARLFKDRGVPVHVVGLGTVEPARDLAREKLPAAAFAPLRMPTLEQLSCSPDAVRCAACGTANGNSVASKQYQQTDSFGELLSLYQSVITMPPL